MTAGTAGPPAGTAGPPAGTAGPPTGTAGVWARDPERAARVALSFLVEPRSKTLRDLVAADGAAEALAAIREGRAPRSAELGVRLEALDLPGLTASVRAAGARVVVPGDAEWVPLLDRLEEPPLCLYVRGELDLAETAGRAVAVVGSRMATAYGQEVARDLGEGLGSRGWGVVSGAAVGIDVAAHQGALAVEGATVAVLACGVDRAYPLQHREVLRRIAAVGAVVSEVPPGSLPLPRRFLARNRIIAALSRATVVVEASVRSGARSTAGEATRLHLPVGAVPGPVTSMVSAGCHELVRDGSAVLVTDVDDVLELAAPIGEELAEPRRGESRDTDVLTEAEQDVLAVLPLRGGGTDLRGVVVRAGRPDAVVVAALGVLDTLGFAVRHEDRWRAVRPSGGGVGSTPGPGRHSGAGRPARGGGEEVRGSAGRR